MEPNQPKIPPRPVGPRWLDKLLSRLVAPHLREEVLGDIHERYALRVQRLGEHKARRTYWREALASVERLSDETNPRQPKGGQVPHG
jgi:hypothetical protein